MKTTFSRLFSMIAGLLMLCLLITGVAFRFLMMSWVDSEKHQHAAVDSKRFRRKDDELFIRRKD